MVKMVLAVLLVVALVFSAAVAVGACMLSSMISREEEQRKGRGQ